MTTPPENVSLALGAKIERHDLAVGRTARYFAAITTASATTSAAAYDSHDPFVT